MKTFEESGWQFQFADHWEVIPYDRHRYYRYVSGHGLKGIDFLAWNRREERLLLLEVKNFAPSDWEGPSPNMELVLRNPRAYAERMIEKFTDSLRLFAIVHRYRSRKWGPRYYWRLRDQWLPRRWRSLLPLSIWERAYRLSQRPGASICLCLWIQLADEVARDEAQDFMMELEEILGQSLAQQGFTFLLASPQRPLADIQIRRAN